MTIITLVITAESATQSRCNDHFLIRHTNKQQLNSQHNSQFGYKSVYTVFTCKLYVRSTRYTTREVDFTSRSGSLQLLLASDGQQTGKR